MISFIAGDTTRLMAVFGPLPILLLIFIISWCACIYIYIYMCVCVSHPMHSEEHRELWLEGLSRAIEDSLHADRLHYGSLGAGSALDPRQPAVLVERRESFGSTVSANSGMESGGTFVPPSSLDQSLAGSSVTSRNLMLHVRSSSPPPPLGQEGGEDPMLSGSGTTLLSAPGPPAHQSSSSSQVQTATSTSSLGSAGSTGSCHSEVIVEGSVEVDQPRSRRRTLTEGQREEALRAFPPPKNPILFASSRVLLGECKKFPLCFCECAHHHHGAHTHTLLVSLCFSVVNSLQRGFLARLRRKNG